MFLGFFCAFFFEFDIYLRANLISKCHLEVIVVFCIKKLN